MAKQESVLLPSEWVGRNVALKGIVLTPLLLSADGRLGQMTLLAFDSRGNSQRRRVFFPENLLEEAALLVRGNCVSVVGEVHLSVSSELRRKTRFWVHALERE